MKAIWMLTIVLFCKVVLAEQEWLFPMPVYYDDRVVGEINVFTDGETSSGVPANELNKVLSRVVSANIRQEIARYGSQKISNEELNALGVILRFNASDLSLDVALQADATNQDLIDFDGIYRDKIYSESTFIAWHNVFNFTNDYVHDNDDNAANRWLGEWIATGNLGGPFGLNFEAAGYVEGLDSEVFESESRVYRGDVKMFVDRPRYPMRVSVGDVSTVTSGHIPSLNIGGVSLERLWASLQPERNIQNGGSQTIYLRESANVFIYINDIYFTDLRLSPGRYQLEDLPLAQGSNDIRIEIRYQSGQREVINYSQFFNTRLLRQGISDFSLYAGVVSNVVDTSYEYDEEQYVAQGFYEYGLTDHLTVGLNSAYHPDGQIVGGVINLGAPFGNIGSRFSALAYSDEDEFGSIASLDYEHSIFGNYGYTTPNIRISYEAFNDYRPTPWIIGGDLNTGMRVFGDYRYYVTSDIDYTIRGNWILDSDTSESSYFGALEITWAPYDFSFTSSVEYQYDDGTGIGETSYYFVARWDWFSSLDFYAASAEYQTRTNRVRGTFSKFSQSTPGGYGYELTADVGENDQDYSVRGDYVANRFTTELEYQTDLDNLSDEQNQAVSARFSTAVSILDTNVAWGRSYRGPAVIIGVHDSLEAPVLINGVSEDEPESIATRNLSGLVPIYGAHGSSTVYVDVPDAPLGYDYGPDSYEFTAGTYTGHTIKVGSDASKTVIGQMWDQNGKPISLRNGVIILESEEKAFFTNKAGRFALDGMQAGRYRIEMRGRPYFIGELIIADSESNLVYLEPIKLTVKGRQP
ncbi:fimbria/pilus outer membrane usher protein [Vibrio breoganii]|uniref:fimbria/pilus outer membrane usher protein n=1 Tax=Vibrio breoganii TaxID=553239 RepID=UPI000C857746|nr:fimbria/pilus outer membrane usher protein [Vibrio breoganii]PMM46263.1 hypothetical protein BCT52_07605 [Vibrio breoganii]